MKKDILILTSGSVNKIENLKADDVVLASFSDIYFVSDNNGLFLKDVGDLKEFKVIYFRMIGKSLEVATLVARYAKENNIKIVDEVYENSELMPMTIAKSIETTMLYKNGIKIPKTSFADLERIDYPFVVKSTTGQKAKEVWLVNNHEDLLKLKENKFEKGKFYFSQKLVPNARRIRVLVVGDKVLGAIVRQTKWNKDHTKITLNPVPEKVSSLALKASKVVGLNICGVDILENSETGEMFLIETNAAPAWELINKYCSVNVEQEILNFLRSFIKND